MPSCIYFTVDKLDRWNLSRIRLVRMIHVSFCRRIKSIVQKTLTNKLLADNSQLYCVIHAIRSGGCELGLLEFDNTHVQMIRDFFQHLTWIFGSILCYDFSSIYITNLLVEFSTDLYTMLTICKTVSFCLSE